MQRITHPPEGFPPSGFLFDERWSFCYKFIVMRFLFTTVITEETPWFVARAAELGVVSQGKSAEEAESNLKEAVELFLGGEAAKHFKKQAAIIKSSEVEYA